MREFSKVAFLGILTVSLAGTVACEGPAEPGDEVSGIADEDGVLFAEGGCRDRCLAHAREVLEACRAEGGDNCRERVAHALRACAEECGDTDTDRPCADRCGRAGRIAHHKCMERGGSDEECLALAKKVVRGCATRCMHRGADRPTCGDLCIHIARRAGAACHEAGGSDERCRAAAEEAGSRCIERCRAAGDRPDGDRPEGDRPPGDRPEGDRPDGACAERCRGVGADAGAACIDDGGTPEECRAAAEEAARACFGECA